MDGCWRMTSHFSIDSCCRLFNSHEHRGSSKWTQWVSKEQEAAHAFEEKYDEITVD